MVIIDGTTFSGVVAEVKRSFTVMDSDNTGRTLDGVMHRDVIGTYYNYDITFTCNNVNGSTYDRLYDILSQPTESHSITVPFGQSTLTYEAYITSGKDVLKKYKPAIWGELQVSCIAMRPNRT